MSKKISILSTGELGNEVAGLATDMGIELDIIPFIETVYNSDAAVRARVLAIAKERVIVAFTSQHAVMSVARMIGSANVKWSIYCLGNKTQSVVNHHFASKIEAGSNVNVKGIGDDAEELANIIVKDNVKNIVFFCGDKRMDTLPDILNNAGITVEECVVYQTLEISHATKKVYDGILFFSPSGVNSYFNMNKVGLETMLFAIGSTTAKAIGQYTSNKVIISSKPVKHQMLEEVIEYFGVDK